MVWVVVSIIALIIIIYLSAKKGDAEQTSSTENEAITSEIITYINSVQSLFVNEEHLNGETIGGLSIIPINENKEMYRPDSCKVMLHVILYDESDWKINSVLLTAKLNDSPFEDFFCVESFNGQQTFGAYPHGRFSGNYKPFMSSLFNKIDSVYPGKFRFNGSLIISKDNFGEKIF